jgi:hypothetical protein
LLWFPRVAHRKMRANVMGASLFLCPLTGSE